MSFKKFETDDFFTNEYYTHEGVRIYYRQLSGSAGELNLKLPPHYRSGDSSGSYYLEVHDKPTTDPSANRLLSIAYGYTSSSLYYSGSFSGTHSAPKILMYRLFAKRLLGSETKKFSLNGRELDEAIFLSVARNQYKDAFVSKGTLFWYYLTGSPGREPQTGSYSYGFATDYYSKVTSEFAGEVTQMFDVTSQTDRGLIFSKAGIVVLDPAIFPTTFSWSGSMSYENLAKGLSGTTHNDLLWSIKNRIWFWDFSGSSKTVSGFYQCTAEPDEFNYSSNPSARATDGEIITTISSSIPNSYITQIALLGKNQEVVAIAKLRSPVKKNFDRGVKIVVRLDT